MHVLLIIIMYDSSSVYLIFVTMGLEPVSLDQHVFSLFLSLLLSFRGIFLYSLVPVWNFQRLYKIFKPPILHICGNYPLCIRLLQICMWMMTSFDSRQENGWKILRGIGTNYETVFLRLPDIFVSREHYFWSFQTFIAINKSLMSPVTTVVWWVFQCLTHLVFVRSKQRWFSKNCWVCKQLNFLLFNKASSLQFGIY